MKISQKLLIGFGIISIFLIVNGILGIMFASAINDRVTRVTKLTSPTVETVDNMIITLWKNNKILREFSGATDAERLEQLRKEYDKLNLIFDEESAEVRDLISEQNLVANLDFAQKKFDSFNEHALEMMLAHKNELQVNAVEEKEQFKQQKQVALQLIEEDVEKAVNVLEQIAIRVGTFNQQANEESSKVVRNTMVVLSLTTVIGFAFAILIGLVITKLILTPIEKLSKAAYKVSNGNFDVQIQVEKSDDELNKLTRTFNQMTKSLKNLLEQSPRLKKFIDIKPTQEDLLETEQKYDLDSQTSYVIKERSSKKAFDIFVDKVTHGYQGLCVSRTNPQEIRERYGLQKTSIIWMTQTKADNDVFASADLQIIEKAIKDFIQKSKNGIILLDRIDYLITQHGFDAVLRFILRVNDQIMMNQAVMIIPIDEETVNRKDLSYIEKELRDLPAPTTKAMIAPDLLKLLQFIKDKKVLNDPATFKDVKSEFSITAPTAQRKIQDLETKGYVKIIKQGRNKYLTPTLDGRKLLE